MTKWGLSMKSSGEARRSPLLKMTVTQLCKAEYKEDVREVAGCRPGGTGLSALGRSL